MHVDRTTAPGPNPPEPSPRIAQGTWDLPDALAIGGVLVLVLVMGVIVRAAPPAFDGRLSAVLVATCPAWLASAGETLGSLPVIAAVSAALLLLSAGRRRWLDAGAVLIGVASEIPTELLKAVVDRPRPPTAHEVEALGSIASYPSGHVVRLVVIGGLVAALAFGRSRRSWIGATVVVAVLAGLVGIARIGAGAHWPTDVLGGVLLGSAWLEIALVLPSVIAAWIGRRPASEAPLIR